MPIKNNPNEYQYCDSLSSHHFPIGHKCPESGSISIRGANHSVIARKNGTFTYVRNGCRSVRSRAISANCRSSSGLIVFVSLYCATKRKTSPRSAAESNADSGKSCGLISSPSTFHETVNTSPNRHSHVFSHEENPRGTYSSGISAYRGARNCASCSTRQFRAAHGSSGKANPAAISAVTRINLLQSAGRRHKIASTTPTPASSSGVSGRTSVPNPATIPPSSHRIELPAPIPRAPAPPTSCVSPANNRSSLIASSSTSSASAVKNVASVSVSTTAV